MEAVCYLYAKLNLPTKTLLARAFLILRSKQVKETLYKFALSSIFDVIKGNIKTHYTADK